MISKLPYSKRAEYCKNKVAQQLFQLIATKKTNLALSADVTTKQQLLQLIEAVGKEICILKTHVDIIKDFDEDLITQIQRLAVEYNFLIFEDRKFADIGNTVKLQYEGGIYHIADWADMINAHSVLGPGIIAGLKEVGLPKQRGLLMLAELSSQGNLAYGAYTQATVEMAKQNPDFVIGFIAQHQLTDDPAFIHMTPGIQLAAKGDNLGQQYVDPQKAIIENGTDIIIVGRGIYAATDPQAAAQQYRELGWEAYCKLAQAR